MSYDVHRRNVFVRSSRIPIKEPTNILFPDVTHENFDKAEAHFLSEKLNGRWMPCTSDFFRKLRSNSSSLFLLHFPCIK